MIIRTVVKITHNIVPIFKMYSNTGYYLKNINTSKLHKEVVTPVNYVFNYEETDILIPVKEEKKVEETIKEE